MGPSAPANVSIDICSYPIPSRKGIAAAVVIRLEGVEIIEL